jgi:DNA polymerase III delta prime subunit
MGSLLSLKIKSYLDRLADSQSRPSSYIFAGQDEEPKPVGAEASASPADKLAGKEEAAFFFISKIAEKLDDSNFLERIKTKNHPDVMIIEPEIVEKKGKTREKEITISQVRDMLERIKFFPYELKQKFCLIKKAEKMNAEAANALLKSLEEPSESAIFILLARDAESILPTIVSRCAVLRFPKTELPKWNEANREQFKKMFQEEVFEKFDYIEKVSKNKIEIAGVLRDWEMVMAESLRKLIGSNEDWGKIKKVIELIEGARDSINRLEQTNASARSAGEELMLRMS